MTNCRGWHCGLRQWQPEVHSDPVCWRVYAANLSRTTAQRECGCARLPGQALATGGAHGFPYSAQEEKGGMDEAGENKALLIGCVLHTFFRKEMQGRYCEFGFRHSKTQVLDQQSTGFMTRFRTDSEHN